MTTFYYCYAEGQAPHYATEDEAQYTVEFLRQQDDDYAEITLDDLYEEVAVEDLDLNAPWVLDGSTRQETVHAIERAQLRHRLEQALDGEAAEWFRRYVELEPYTVPLDSIITGGEAAALYDRDGSTVRRTATYDWMQARKADGRTWLIRRADAEARWGNKR